MMGFRFEDPWWLLLAVLVVAIGLASAAVARRPCSIRTSVSSSGFPRRWPCA